MICFFLKIIKYIDRGKESLEIEYFSLSVDFEYIF